MDVLKINDDDDDDLLWFNIIIMLDFMNKSEKYRKLKFNSRKANPGFFPGNPAGVIVDPSPNRSTILAVFMWDLDFFSCLQFHVPWIH